MQTTSKMHSLTIGCLTIVFLSTGSALADPIEGTWKRPESKGGTLETISPCGDSYCVTVASGEHKGKSAGKMTPTGEGSYEGTLTDIAANKTYNGKAVLTGGDLIMKGCVLGGLFCLSETWRRQ